MKKRVLSILLTVCMLFALVPMTALADESEVNLNPSIDWSGACNTVNTHTVNVYELLPSDANITSMQVASGVGSPILSSITPGWSSDTATLEFVTKALAEPASGKVVLVVETSNYDDITVTINIKLTGKYIVNINALPMDVLYDGNAHNGYSNLSGTLTSGATYKGEYTYTYEKADGTPISGAPSEVGSYKVTIAVPADNADYTGSKTLNFNIISAPVAIYQTEENGEWIDGAFTQALANVYEGGTVKLIKDIVLTETVTVAKNVTITSNDASSPCKITSTTDQHGYLLRLSADVTIKNIIIDGGNADNITASRAMIAVGDGTNSGKLTLGEGSVLRNNNNTTTNGAGGAVCVILGDLVVKGSNIYGNSAFSGSAIAVMANSCNVTIENGTVISDNSATNTGYSGGGAIYIAAGTVTMTGGEIKNNSATNCGGAVYIYQYYTSQVAIFKLQGGEISGNSAKYGAGIYINCTDLLELSGGSITGNIASSDGGGVYASPYAVISMSGDTKVYGNTADRNGKNVYLLYSPTVTVGDLDSTAQVDIFTIEKPAEGGELLVANPVSGYTITADDLSRLSYEDKAYSLKINDSGNLVLTDVPLSTEVELENYATSEAYTHNDTQCASVMVVSDVIDDISVYDTLYMTDGTDVRKVTLSDVINTKITGSVEIGILVKNIPLANVESFKAKFAKVGE